MYRRTFSTLFRNEKKDKEISPRRLCVPSKNKTIHLKWLVLLLFETLYPWMRYRRQVWRILVRTKGQTTYSVGPFLIFVYEVPKNSYKYRVSDMKDH